MIRGIEFIALVVNYRKGVSRSLVDSSKFILLNTFVCINMVFIIIIIHCSKNFVLCLLPKEQGLGQS